MAMVIWLLFMILVLMSVKPEKRSDFLGWIGVGVLVAATLGFLLP